MSKIPIGNIKGPKGDPSTVPGPAGPAGPSTVPAADFIGSEIARPGSPAEQALLPKIVDVGGEVFAQLDENGQLVVGGIVVQTGVTMLPDAAKLLGKLQRAESSACMQVLGDSTALGNVPSTGGSLRWVYQTALYLGSQQPAMSVVIGMWRNAPITDGVLTSGSTTMASASSNFTSADVGRTVSGVPTNSLLPHNTTIVSVTNGQTVVLSNAATGSGSGQNLFLGNYDYTVLQAGTYTRVVTTVGTTNGSTTLTSTVAAFTPADVGRPISGSGIPAGATVTAFASATSITISAAASATAAGVSATFGPHTLTVYNGSISGGAPIQNISNLVVMTPQAPDLTLIAHGHNVGVSNVLDWKQGIPALYRKLRRRWPLSSVALVSQNPVTKANADYDQQLKIRQMISEYAAKINVGFIDSTSVFLAVPNWQTALIDPDTVHPNQAGYNLWSLSLRAYFTYQRTASTNRTPQPLNDRLWFGAAEFAPTGGSTPAPVYSSGLAGVQAGAASAGRVPACWLLDPDVATTVGAYIYIPEDWNSWNTYMFVTVNQNVGGGLTGSAVWQIGTSQLDSFAGEFAVSTPVTVAGTTDIGNIRSTAFGSADGGRIARVEWLWVNQPYKGRGFHLLNVGRFANQAGDTLPIPAGFVGVMFERID